MPISWTDPVLYLMIGVMPRDQGDKIKFFRVPDGTKGEDSVAIHSNQVRDQAQTRRARKDTHIGQIRLAHSVSMCASARQLPELPTGAATVNRLFRRARRRSPRGGPVLARQVGRVRGDCLRISMPPPDGAAVAACDQERSQPPCGFSPHGGPRLPGRWAVVTGHHAATSERCPARCWRLS